MSELHLPCKYVSREIGTDPELKKIFFEDHDLVNQTTEIIEIAHDRPRRVSPTQAALEQEMGLRESAQRVLAALACSACQLRDECTVKQKLEEHASLYALFEKAVQHFTRHATGPDWLQQGRRQRAEYPDIGSFQDAARNEGFLPFSLLGAGVDIEPEKYTLTRNQLPELDNISIIKDDASLPGVRLTTKNHNFIVVDAREVVGLDDHLPNPEELRVLYGKFLGRIIEETPEGVPHILEPDNTMQKVISQTETGRVDELRMSGKNRFYITIHRAENYIRIVLLGIHGGDASTQSKFIASLLRT
jgi:hypothetical protein